MKQLLQKYAAYNHWANNEIVTALLKLTPEQSEQDLGGSFGTLRDTVLHIWNAESTWYQRLLLVEKPIRPADDYIGTFADACSAWVRQSKQLAEWVAAATPARLGHVVAFTRQKNEHYKMQVEDILMHVSNHSTFHRGQIVHMLRQLGIKKVPSTDFNRYTNKN